MDSEDVFAKDDKSGWTWIILPLSDCNFDRLNKEIVGAPHYHNRKGDVWPKPAVGTSVIWTKETSS